MSEPSLRRNFVWAFVGVVIFALCQMLIVIAIAKRGTPRMNGDWTLGLAITAPIFIFCQFKLRIVQATDSRDENRWGEFVALRMLGVAAAFLVVGVIVVALYRDATAPVILGIALSRVFDGGSDLVYGALQRRELMRTIAMSQIYRGVTNVVVGIALLELTGSVALIAAGTAASYAAWFLWDLRQVRAVLGDEPIGPRWDRAPLRRFLWRVAPLGLVTAIASLQVNIPRYFVEAYGSRDEVGIFGVLAQLLALGVLGVNALTNAVVPRLARAAVAEDWARFVRYVWQLMLIGLGIGVCAIATSYCFGGWVLTHLYSPAYARHVDVLVLLAISGTLTWTYVFLATALDALRSYSIQPWIHGTSSLVIVGACAALVPSRGMRGAALAMLIGYVVEAALYGVAVSRRIRTRMRERVTPAVKPR